jgi:antitoxin VapB
MTVATTGQAMPKGVGWRKARRELLGHGQLALELETMPAEGLYHRYSPCTEAVMDTAKLFQSGRSQAVRLPKAYRFSGTEVIVKHFGNGVLLLPIEDPWQTLEAGLAAFEPGFQLSREQPQNAPDQKLARFLAYSQALAPVFCIWMLEG